MMPSFATLLSTAALVALAQAHGVLVVAQGEKGSPNSVGFQGKFENKSSRQEKRNEQGEGSS